MKAPRTLRDAAQELTLDLWIDLVGASLEGPRSVGGLPLPGAPSPEFQAAYVGRSGRAAIKAGGLFYRYALGANDRHRGRAIGRLLDFGCGWGRFTRLLARDVPEEGLYGADPDPAAIRACRELVPFACFVRSQTRPPLPFRDQFFDVIVANSVFSHLAEINAANWIYELSRVLKPDGLLVATTHGPWLLDRVQRLQDGRDPCLTSWEKTLVRSWPDVTLARGRYDRGEFVFSDSGEYPDRDGYGEALVPRPYVWNVWGKIMEPLDYVSDATVVEQSAFVLRRRP